MSEHVRLSDGARAFVHDYEGTAAAATAVDTVAQYAIGWPTFVIADSEQREVSAGWIRCGARAELLRPPPNIRHMIAPRAVSDGRGGVHLVWGDSDESVASLATSVWYAHFNGQTWSLPERVADRASVLWTAVTVGPLLMLADGQLLVVAKRSHVAPEFVVMLRSAKWSRHTVTTGGPAAPNYLDLIELRPRTLILVGVTAYARPGETDLGGAFVARSEDSGRTWSPLVRVSEHATQPPHFTRIASIVDSIGRDNVVLVWRMPGTFADTLRALLSRDGGHSWQALPSLALPPATIGFDIAATCAGTLELAVAARNSSDSRLSDLVSFALSFAGEWRWRPMRSKLPPLNRVPRFLEGGSGQHRLLVGVVEDPRGRALPVNAIAIRRDLENCVRQ